MALTTPFATFVIRCGLPDPWLASNALAVGFHCNVSVWRVAMPVESDVIELFAALNPVESEGTLLEATLLMAVDSEATELFVDQS